jgi:hypothetical protein
MTYLLSIAVVCVLYCIALELVFYCFCISTLVTESFRLKPTEKQINLKEIKKEREIASS